MFFIYKESTVSTMQPMAHELHVVWNPKGVSISKQRGETSKTGWGAWNLPVEVQQITSIQCVDIRFGI